MSEETCKNHLVAVFAVLCGLGEVDDLIRANVFGTLPSSASFPVCAVSGAMTTISVYDGFGTPGLLMTTIRTRLGLNPDIEEGTRRQKQGDVRSHPLPESDKGMPLEHVACVVAGPHCDGSQSC
jgi:hypothetical protein